MYAHTHTYTNYIHTYIFVSLAPQVRLHGLGGVGEEGLVHEGDRGGGPLDVHHHVLDGCVCERVVWRLNNVFGRCFVSAVWGVCRCGVK